MAFPFSGGGTVFRLGHRDYPLFDGAGASTYGSRWCTPGRYIVHTASSYALAVLENVVHWGVAALPPGLHFIQITIPARVKRQVLEPHELADWAAYPYGPSQTYGDRWYDAGKTAVLVVPSVLSPFEPNVLVNQRHPQFSALQSTEPRPAQLDTRLIQT